MDQKIRTGLTSEQFEIVLAFSHDEQKMQAVKDVFLQNNYELWVLTRMYNLQNDFTRVAYLGE
jgi:dephospho-CoA kinase